MHTPVAPGDAMVFPIRVMDDDGNMVPATAEHDISVENSSNPDLIHPMIVQTDDGTKHLRVEHGGTDATGVTVKLKHRSKHGDKHLMHTFDLVSHLDPGTMALDMGAAHDVPPHDPDAPSPDHPAPPA